MRNDIRFAVVPLALIFAIACGAPSNQPAPSGAAPGETPAAGAAGAPASTPGAEMRGEGAAPKEKEPIITTMPMDVVAGTDLVLTLETPVSSETAKSDQPVRARVAKPVIVSGMTAIPEGSVVTGAVVSAERAGRVKGRASVVLRFNEVIVSNQPHRITTARISRLAEATKGEDATKIGIAAGVGTAIGAIAGGKKGAAIGAGVGGGAGTGAVLATRGKEVTIPAGATLRTTITETVRVTAPM
jgi:hypothetical protein